MFVHELHKVWKQLRGKRLEYTDYLESVTIKNFRGIGELRLPLFFPVSVLAGTNGCGKTTALYACACLYAKGREYTPSAVFPALSSNRKNDASGPASFEYSFLSAKRPRLMKWSKTESQWNRSFMGEKGAKPPERPVYIRTLANLANPSEVRGLLKFGEKEYEEESISPEEIAFAARVLTNFAYGAVTWLKSGDKNLIFAERKDVAAAYSEFQMSAGERAVLRLSKEVSRLRDALVLIDEIETGLHPYTQQQLMLELQRLALRNDLQIVVTTHSPVVLDCVPDEGRLFLERTAAGVEVKPAYRHVIQRAFYGQSINKLSVLCEDEMGESMVLGCLDVVNPKLGMVHGDVVIGRDTGKNAFPGHVEAFAKFGKLEETLFVLDGDAKALENKIIEAGRGRAQPLFLPGDDNPEAWVFQTLAGYREEYAGLLGVSVELLADEIRKIDHLYASATGKPAEIAKSKLATLANVLKTKAEVIARICARREAEVRRGDMAAFIAAFEDKLREWRTKVNENI